MLERRLSKRDVEALLSAYDNDPVGAIETALRRLCDRPAAGYDDLLQWLFDRGHLDVERWQALRHRECRALDALVRELNETRSLPS